MRSLSLFDNAMPLSYISDGTDPQVWHINSFVRDNATSANRWRFSIVHGSLARSRRVGFVVTPWNMPRGRRVSHYLRWTREHIE